MRLWLIGILVLAAGLAQASEHSTHSEVAESLAAAAKLGTADVRMLGFNLYKAELWTEDSEPFDFEQPFALSLTYKRRFSAGQLVSGSIREIARIEDMPERELEPLRATLQFCFADVQAGDRITGLSQGDTARFFFNGEPQCEIEDETFSNRFFGIWLSEETRDRRSRNRLLGMDK